MPDGEEKAFWDWVNNTYGWWKGNQLRYSMGNAPFETKIDQQSPYYQFWLSQNKPLKSPLTPEQAQQEATALPVVKKEAPTRLTLPSGEEVDIKWIPFEETDLQILAIPIEQVTPENISFIMESSYGENWEEVLKPAGLDFADLFNAVTDESITSSLTLRGMTEEQLGSPRLQSFTGEWVRQKTSGQDIIGDMPRIQQAMEMTFAPHPTKAQPLPTGLDIQQMAQLGAQEMTAQAGRSIKMEGMSEELSRRRFEREQAFEKKQEEEWQALKSRAFAARPERIARL